VRVSSRIAQVLVVGDAPRHSGPEPARGAHIPPTPGARDRSSLSCWRSPLSSLLSAPRADLLPLALCHCRGKSGTCEAGAGLALQAPAPPARRPERCLGQARTLQIEARAPGSGSASGAGACGVQAEMKCGLGMRVLRSHYPKVTQWLRSHYAQITQTLRTDYAVITQRLRRHYAQITQTLRSY